MGGGARPRYLRIEVRECEAGVERRPRGDVVDLGGCVRVVHNGSEAVGAQTSRTCQICLDADGEGRDRLARVLPLPVRDV